MEELIRQINEFAEQADIIEPDAARRKELLGAVNGYVERFLEDLPERPAFVFTEDMGAGLYDSPIAEEGMEVGEILRVYKDNVDDQGLSPVSGKFFGYIPPCSMYYSALGDYLAAVTDEFAGEFASCPGAVRMEYQLLDWMAELVGYSPGEARGALASGGGVMREVATDAQYRMDPHALDRMIRADRDAGLIPWLVVGSAGTTDLGNVDELDRLGAIAHRHGLWFHVDGAYGGFFVMCDMVRDRFREQVMYFNTFSGNAVQCAVGMAVLDVIEEEDPQENCLAVGEYTRDGLRALQSEYELVGNFGVRVKS